MSKASCPKCKSKMTASDMVILERSFMGAGAQMRLDTKICKNCGYTEFYNQS